MYGSFIFSLLFNMQIIVINLIQESLDKFSILGFFAAVLFVGGISWILVLLPGAIGGWLLEKQSEKIIKQQTSSRNPIQLFGAILGIIGVSWITIPYVVLQWITENIPGEHKGLPLIHHISTGVLATIIAAICGALAGREIHRRNLARLAAGQEEAGE